MSAAVAPIHSLERDRYAPARQIFTEVETEMASRDGQDMDHSEMERMLTERMREVQRELYQAWLEQKAAGEVTEPVIDTEGRERTHKRERTRKLETLFGTVTVRRTGYGERGSKSLHPLDAVLNLPEERYSLGVRRRAAEEAARSSFDDTVEALARHTGARVPKRQVEELVSRAAQDFESFYQMRREKESGLVPAPGSMVVITADGKGVLMHREDLRPQSRAAAEQELSILGDRVTRARKRHRKRMAAVASVYCVQPHVRTPEEAFRSIARIGPRPAGTARPRPQHKRVWASLEQEPLDVLGEAFEEALLRDPGRTGTWAAVVDGNEHQLDIIEKLQSQYGVGLTIVLDVFHVLTYLWKAGRALEGEDDKQVERWVYQRLLRLLEGRAVMVAAGMRRSATLRGLAARRREPVDQCADYLLKYQGYLAYDEYLAAGLPIASGVIEGACRHLVNDRLGLTGARWRLLGAEAVLKLRALRASGDFDEYWAYHEACERERNHLRHYAGGNAPHIEPVIETRSRKPRPRA